MRDPLLALAGLLLALTPALAGCSDGSDEPASPSAPSTSAYPTILPSPTTGASLAQSPCDLLGPKDWARYVSPKLRKLAYESPGISLTAGRFRTCGVRVGLLTFLTFGYAPVDEVWAAVKKATRPRQAPDVGSDAAMEAAESFAEVQRVSIPAGEEGFVYSALGGVTIEGYARSRDVAYVISPLTGLSGVGYSGADIASTMVPLVANGDRGVDPTPIALPADCPAVDSRIVTDLVGTVALARGGAFRGIPPVCEYQGEDGETLSVLGAILPGTSFQSEYASDALGDAVEVLDPPPGPLLEYYRDSEGEHSVWAMYPKGALHIGFAASGGDRAAVLRFARAYLADHAPNGGGQLGDR